MFKNESLKKICRFSLLLLVFFSVSSTLGGCATKTKIALLQPARYHEATLAKTVAVLPFNGQSGHEWSFEVEGVLGGVSVDGKPYFTLVERSAIDRAMEGQNLYHSGIIDQKAALRLGKSVRAQGVYTGDITNSGCSDSPYFESRSQCGQYEIKYDKKGEPYEGDCISWMNYNVQCTRKTATFSWSPKLIDVKTGRILYSKNLTGTASSSGCEDTSSPTDDAKLLEQAKGKVKSEFRQDVAPFYVEKIIKLKDSCDGITAEDARSKLKEGLKYAADNHIDTACALWGQARALCPETSPSLAFNLGVCAEAKGDARSALDMYRMAEKLLGKPDEEITLALQRASEAVNSQRKLKEQLRTGKK
jgi:hypothetical protein